MPQSGSGTGRLQQTAGRLRLASDEALAAIVMVGEGPIGVKIAAVVAISSCRAKARHPRLAVLKPRKGVDGGPSPTMTSWERPCHLSRHLTPMGRRPTVRAFRRYQYRKAWMAARSLCPGLSRVAAMTMRGRAADPSQPACGLL